MLVEVDCNVGEPGRGGAGGNSGEGGKRGYGGEGGSWVEPNPEGEHEGSVHTVTGVQGKPGSSGAGGSDGRTGRDGSRGRDGGLLWVVDSPSGEVLHQAGRRYEASVTSLKTSPALQDGVYEPNQAITVSEVVIVNTGGLPLPKGAKLFFPSTMTTRFEPTVYELPEIYPNGSFTVPQIFSGRIFDQCTPNSPGSFSGEASFAPRVELLGRPFENLSKQTLPVSYPVKLMFALSKKNMSSGGFSVLEVGVENTSSSAAYGSSKAASGCRGSIAVRLHLDPKLVLLGVQHNSKDKQKKALPFQVMHDPEVCDSVWVKIEELSPGDVLVIPIAFMVDLNAQLRDTCVWQADLYFKGKFVEYKSQEIHVTPTYSPGSSLADLGDVLMITSELISTTEFSLWQRIFEILDVNVDYWDASRRKEDTTPDRIEAGGSDPTGSARAASSSSSPTDSNVSFNPILDSYSSKAIIYPHCKLDDIPAEHIVSHFNCSNSSDSSMLLFMSPSVPTSLEHSYYNNTRHAQIFRHLCRVQNRIKLPENMHSGYHLLPPGTVVSSEVTIEKSEKKIIKKLEGDHPLQALAMFSLKRNIDQKSLLKYTYGTMDIRKCPIQRSCNFQCVDGAGGSLASMGADDPLLTIKSREFPLASKFGQVFLAVLVAIPLKCKLNLLKAVDDKSSQGCVKFYLPNGMHLSKQQLAAIAIAHVVADEILDTTGSISLMNQVVDDLHSNRNLYSKNWLASTVNQMLCLIHLEALERAKRYSNPTITSAAKQLQKLCKAYSISDTFHSGQNQFPNSDSPAAKTPSKTPSLPGSPCTPAAITSPGGWKAKARGSSHHLDTASSIVKGLESLPPLRILQDSMHVLRSHQLTVEDNCYNITSK